MAAVAVTEPDYGSDVAGIKVTATAGRRARTARPGYVINGVKTWCTFGARADVLMLLARTDPDRAKTHRGLSLFIVPKPRGEGHGFEFTQDRPPATAPAGKMEGRPIDTIGYRGMHSYEIALDNWWVPATNLIGEAGRARQGLLLPDGGLRERPAADRRARDRRDAGRLRGGARLRPATARCSARPIVDYQLTQVKLGRMAVLIQAGRQFSYAVAKLMAKGEGAIEASMVKAYVCKAAEWVTREAMQIHGGYGYAEEYPRQPPVRRRPGAEHLRGRRRDPVPEGHRPPPHATTPATAGAVSP